ncbi:hypothetical protein FOC1_g10000501 [Fusarium oxysporum f. sp. cubense race 1]|uniref:CCHC-type domain-containing protein n=2 Tax=Fusarium oxysporum f. sp. cubense TaxID=61366 RepID=N4U9J3_FUSC1|nr:hypothetical protein FOC1_g10000501 [Fusarium oxysporum f. sp. cubense race 1]
MTIDEGREAISQMDVDTQGVAELSRSGDRGGSARLKESRCGICGKAGHNRRTCQIIVYISGEEDSN